MFLFDSLNITFIALKRDNIKFLSLRMVLKKELHARTRPRPYVKKSFH